MPTELRLAAIIALLSSSALCGATAGKASALRAHLEAAALTGDPMNAQLRSVLEDTLAAWLTIECHQKSVSVNCCALAAAGQVLH